MHAGSVSRAFAILAMAPVVLWLGCGGGADLTGPPAGSLQVTTATTGPEPDPDGYAVSIDGGASQAIGANASRQIDGLSVGAHTVELAGLASNCSLSGGARLDVEVAANTVTPAGFAVTCGATTGAIAVTTATAGSPADPDGYDLTLDGGPAQPIGTAATVTLSGLTPGTHTIALGGLAPNCAVDGDNPKGVTVTAGATSPVAITVTCAPPTPPPAPGSISVTTQTTGADRDADGYAVTLDGGAGLPIGTTGTLALADLAPGSHSVGLSGISANCRLDGDNPRTVAVTSGTVSPVTFQVSCQTLPPSTGSLELATVTTGANPDPDGYTFALDDGAAQTIGVNTRVTVASLAPGSHTVTLRGASANCTVGGDNPRTFTVTAGGTAGVTFTVTCAAATGTLQVAAATTGSPPDPDGYTASVDGGSPAALGTNGSVTLSGLEPRKHTVQLGGLAANCRAQGQNPRDVTVPAGETVVTTFDVACTPITGTLQITVGGLPAGTDAAVTVTGPGGFAASVTASATLASLAPGDYTVAAADVSQGGTTYTASPASRTLAVTANATARVTIAYGPASGPSLNLRVDGFELTQSVQTPEGSVPLITDRDGLLRVFVLANETNSAAPSVRVRLFRNGALVQTLTIPAPGGSTPTSRNEADLTGSWNVKIPRGLFTPGLAMLAEVDPGNTVAESNETDNSFPASGTAQPQTVRTVPELALRFVPIKQRASGAQGDVSQGSRADFLRLTRRVYPIAAIDGDVHAPVTTSTSDALESDDANGAWSTILNELDVLRVMEGTSRTYYGVVRVDYPSGIAGLGYIGRPTAMGYDRGPDESRVMAHELGHTWHRLHSPCGQPAGVDPAYPYPGGTTGVHGYDLQENVLRSPSAPDVMGYCVDPWISDYTYDGVLDYRIATQAAEARAARAPEQPCLVIWGRIVGGRPVLEPAFEVTTRPSLPKAPGAYMVEGRSADGGRVFGLSFDAAEVADDRHDGRQFAFAVPMDGATIARLASLRLETPGGAVAAARSAAPAARRPDRRRGRGPRGRRGRAPPLGRHRPSDDHCPGPGHARSHRPRAGRRDRGGNGEARAGRRAVGSGRKPCAPADRWTVVGLGGLLRHRGARQRVDGAPRSERKVLGRGPSRRQAGATHGPPHLDEVGGRLLDGLDVVARPEKSIALHVRHERAFAGDPVHSEYPEAPTGERQGVGHRPEDEPRRVADAARRDPALWSSAAAAPARENHARRAVGHDRRTARHPIPHAGDVRPRQIRDHHHDGMRPGKEVRDERGVRARPLLSLGRVEHVERVSQQDDALRVAGIHQQASRVADAYRVRRRGLQEAGHRWRHRQRRVRQRQRGRAVRHRRAPRPRPCGSPRRPRPPSGSWCRDRRTPPPASSWSRRSRPGPGPRGSATPPARAAPAAASWDRVPVALCRRPPRARGPCADSRAPRSDPARSLRRRASNRRPVPRGPNRAG